MPFIIQCNGKEIKWEHLMDLYKRDSAIWDRGPWTFPGPQAQVGVHTSYDCHFLKCGLI